MAERVIGYQIALALVAAAFAGVLQAASLDLLRLFPTLGALSYALILFGLRLGVARRLKIATGFYIVVSIFSYIQAISGGLYLENLYHLGDAVLCLAATYYLLTRAPRSDPKDPSHVRI